MDILSKLGFKNIEYDEMQIVDEMSMIPLLSDGLSKNISSPENIQFFEVGTYGSMEFKNADSNTNNYGIVPSNTMILNNKVQVQDHAMIEAGVVKAGTYKNFSNACCVQEKQHGFLNGTNKNNEYDILPLGLRRAATREKLRQDCNCGKLWPAIREWLKGFNFMESYAHLEYFFTPFKKQLDDFVAEFEPVKNQIGAIILFGNMLAGIEIMPTIEHWNHYWKWLVRGCYGAELLKIREIGQIELKSISIPEMPFDSINNYLNMLKDTILNSLNLNFNELGSKNYGENQLKHKLIKIESGGGDLILENNKPIYLSCVL
jgi:hypothetical protein